MPAELTKDACLGKFMEAWAALDQVVTHKKASSQEVAEARRAQGALTHNFIRDQLGSLSERTALFKAFIAEMETVIATLSGKEIAVPIKRIQGIIDDAKSVLVAPAGGGDTGGGTGGATGGTGGN